MKKNLKNNKKTDPWIENYRVMNCSYQLVCPWSGWGMDYFQKVFFGKKIITEHFNHQKGLNLLGAYYRKSELREVIDFTIEKIFNDPDFIEKNHKESHVFNKIFFDYGNEFLKFDFKSVPNKELAKILDDFIFLQERAHCHSISTTWFVDSDGQDITNKLLTLAEKYVTGSKSSVKVSEAFSLLTTPNKLSLLNEEEIESLKVLKIILEDKESTEIIKNLKKYDVLPEAFPKKLKNKITSHISKWEWTPFGYLGPAYKLGDYLKFWQEKIKENVDIEKEIKEKTERPKSIKKEKDKLKKELKISAKDARVFEIGADIVFLKGYRKDVTFHGFYVFDKFLSELSRRTYLSKNQLNVMSYIEIIDVLKGKKKIDTAELNDRLKNDVVLEFDEKIIKIISGKKAKEFLKKEGKYMEKEEFDPNATEFKGVCACSGKAEGTVKIINTPDEMSKMKKGDIMISHTTFPSLVPAMKLAAAIATEDGGITCHAAIVSRELGTPCVTGIKVLTKVLKDGDVIEVDADKGIVRILQK